MCESPSIFVEIPKTPLSLIIMILIHVQLDDVLQIINRNNSLYYPTVITALCRPSPHIIEIKIYIYIIKTNAHFFYMFTNAIAEIHFKKTINVKIFDRIFVRVNAFYRILPT